MESRKQNGVIVALVLAIIVIIGLIFYICYDKEVFGNADQKKEVTTTSEPKKEKEEQKLEINNDIVQRLYQIFRMDHGCYLTVDGLNHDNLVKLRIAYDNISSSNFQTMECSQLEPAQYPREYCGNDHTNPTGEGSFTSTVSEDVIAVKVRELFGSDYEVHHESFDTAGHTVKPSSSAYMKYDATHHLYAKFNAQGGGTCGGAATQSIVSATKKGDELYIVTNFVHPRDGQSKVTYMFQKDKENGNYFFVKATQE